MPTATHFSSIGDAFSDMGVPEVRETINTLSNIFTQLVDHEIEALSWDVTQAVAEGLTSIELLLDYLAQQVFDQKLLTQANEYTAKATQLLNDYIAAPDTVNDTFLTQKPAATNVLRYDDSGEIAPASEQNIQDEAVTDSNEDDEMTQQLEDTAVDNIESEALAAVREQVKPDEFEMDADIRDIFIEEAGEVITDLEDFLPIWEQDAQDLTPLTEVRRGFHTLKGSGRMVGAFSISEMAWSIENLLNRLLDKTLPVTDNVVSLVMETAKILPVLVTDFEAEQVPSFDPAIIMLKSHNLMTQQPINSGLGLPEPESVDSASESSLKEEASVTVHDTELVTDNDTTDESQKINDDSDSRDMSASLSDIEIPSVLVPFMQTPEQLAADANDADPDIKEIFIEEANEVLVEILPLYENWCLSITDLSGLADIRRGFHTLKGSGRMVGANYTAELAWAIENMLNRILDNSIAASVDMRKLVGDVLAAYPSMLLVFENNRQDYPSMLPLWIAVQMLIVNSMVMTSVTLIYIIMTHCQIHLLPKPRRNHCYRLI